MLLCDSCFHLVCFSHLWLEGVTLILFCQENFNASMTLTSISLYVICVGRRKMIDMYNIIPPMVEVIFGSHSLMRVRLLDDGPLRPSPKAGL